MPKTIIFIILLVNTMITYAQDLYPYGNKFPLGLYSLHNDLDSANIYGWNHGHRYRYQIDNITYLAAPIPDSYFEECKKNTLHSVARLSCIESLERKWSPSIFTTINEIQQQEKHTNISWWDIPEELRYWENSEYHIIQNYPELIRKYDTKNRPTYMYIPGHYSKEAIKKYVPFLDILPASCYTNYQGLPHVYVRWSIERTQEAIKSDGGKLGKNYLINEKTVIAILELFEQEKLLTKEGTWHDFWLALACDVKGIQIFSHFYRNNSSTLKASWNILNAAVQLFKKWQIDNVLLLGDDIELQNEILEGSKLAPALNIQGEIYNLPSLKILAKQYKDTLYVIAVNSSDGNIIYKLKDIPPLVIESKDLLSGEISEIKYQLLIDTLAPLGVSIFKFYSDQSEINSTIFPSPTDGVVHIKITNSKITFNKINIFNLKGEIIYSVACEYSQEKTISLKHIKKGMYIIQLIRNNEPLVNNKFVISY